MNRAMEGEERSDEGRTQARSGETRRRQRALRKQLLQMFDAVVAEPVPAELLQMLDDMDRQKKEDN